MTCHLPRVLVGIALLSACNSSPPPAVDGGGSRDARPGDATAGDSGDANADGTPGSCAPELDGTPCTGAASCTHAEGCLQVECECEEGIYSCLQQSTCAAGCPEPAETDCRSPCEGVHEACLCRCGGPNYSACSCVSGSWSCPHCGGEG